jgi:phospholipid/cholesterol/gamma-HCH transport system permease protein
VAKEQKSKTLDSAGIWESRQVKAMSPNVRASLPNLVVERKSPGMLVARLSGNWREHCGLPTVEIVRQALSEDTAANSFEFDVTAMTAWDSRLVALVCKTAQLCHDRGMQFKDGGLPEGVRRLLRLSCAAPGKVDMQGTEAKLSFLQELGERAVKEWEGAVGMLAFLGENVRALGNLLRGQAQFRWADAYLIMEQCGAQALGIVALINFLVGLILAFVGAIQLQRFGASIYVADLVGIATVREMACVMTGIIMCGRTGAAFAAQLGTMKLNEEITALQTFGISPIEFLVLPRMVALLTMMPFLCLFANLISITGGFLVSASILDVTPAVYLTRTVQAIELKSFLLGVGKGCFFGFLVAYTGCLRGMQSGHDAAAVGEATTRAVVSGITAIIASDGVFAVISHSLNL